MWDQVVNQIAVACTAESAVREAFPSTDRAKNLTANVLLKNKEVISNVSLDKWPSLGESKCIGQDPNRKQSCLQMTKMRL